MEAMSSPALSLPARARTSLTGGVLAVIAALSGLAAGIHLTVAPEHFDEWWGYGTFFVVAAAGECALVLATGAATTLVGHPGGHLDQPRDDADVPREPHLRRPVRAGQRQSSRRSTYLASPRLRPKAPSSWCSACCSREGSAGTR